MYDFSLMATKKNSSWFPCAVYSHVVDNRKIHKRECQKIPFFFVKQNEKHEDNARIVMQEKKIGNASSLNSCL